MKRGTMRVRAEVVNLRASKERMHSRVLIAAPPRRNVLCCHSPVGQAFPLAGLWGVSVKRRFIGSAADTAALQALGTSTAACQCFQLATGTVAIH
jgi:hypothetical protein